MGATASRRPGLSAISKTTDVTSRMTGATGAATASRSLWTPLRVKKSWTPPLMAMCWINLLIGLLTAGASVTASLTEMAPSLPAEIPETTGAASAQAEMPKAKAWRRLIPPRLLHAKPGDAMIPGRTTGLTIVQITAPTAGATAGQRSVPHSARTIAPSAHRALTPRLMDWKMILKPQAKACRLLLWSSLTPQSLKPLWMKPCASSSAPSLGTAWASPSRSAVAGFMWALIAMKTPVF